MDANKLIKKYNFDVTDLPDQSGINVVEITAIDSEYYTGKNARGKDEEKVRHKIMIRGADGPLLPFKLNNTSVKGLISLFGSETDHWVGHRIGLVAMKVTKFGKEELDAVIHHLSMDDRELTAFRTRKPAGNAGGSKPREQVNNNLDKPIGDETAIQILNELAMRKKDEAFAATLLPAGMREKILLDGLKLPEWPGACLPALRAFCRDFPKTAAGLSEQAKKIQLGVWERARQDRKQDAGVDKETGEVKGNDSDLAADDIPF